LGDLPLTGASSAFFWAVSEVLHSTFMTPKNKRFWRLGSKSNALKTALMRLTSEEAPFARLHVFSARVPHDNAGPVQSSDVKAQAKGACETSSEALWGFEVVKITGLFLVLDSELRDVFLM
jgi:hypothetical protein